MKKLVLLIALLVTVGIVYNILDKPLEITENKVKTDDSYTKEPVNTDKYIGPRIEEVIFNNLWNNSTDGLAIYVPETNVKATINRIVEWRKGSFSKGSYEGKMNKGAALLDHSKITMISSVGNRNNEYYYAAPFHISNQGSGLFCYIGLFKYDKLTQKSSHLDSYFLGDRIDGLTITDQIQAFDIKYLKHGPGQSFTDEPNKPTAFQLGILLDSYKFVNNNINDYPSINIKPNQLISSPFDVTINSRGLWFGSEGELGVITIVDELGNKIGKHSIMTAVGEWMKQGPVEYHTVLEFDSKGHKAGKIIIYNHPGEGDGSESGENKRFEIPVRF